MDRPSLPCRRRHPFEAAAAQRVGHRDRQFSLNPSVSTLALSRASVPRILAPWPRSAAHTCRATPAVGQPSAETRIGAWELVHEPPSRYDGFWLSLILPELALRCRYRVPEFQMILLKFCGPTLVTVPSAAPIWSAGGSACGPPRSPVLIESIGEHLGVVRGIGAEDPGTLATPCNPYLPADHHYPDLNL